jgi:ParB family chromosome partitioning protein
VPEAGACTNCPKRTGFNTLLFSDVRKDSCTDPACFRAKLDAHVAQTLEAKPKLVQISSAWTSREGAPLGRNHYVELEVERTKANGSAAKLSPAQKPCENMTEAIVMDGGKRGQIVKVCSDPNCRVHHPDHPSPQKQERERAEERKRIEQEKLAVTIRHRILAAVLSKVAAPLKKSDLLQVAQYVVAHLPNAQVQTLAKRHKAEADKSSASLESLLAKRIGSYDEAGLCRTLLEITLLNSAYQRGSNGPNDPLLDTAKRYRIDTVKIEKAVAQQIAAQQEKRQNRQTTAKKKAAA